jgi:hypothetical protein
MSLLSGNRPGGRQAPRGAAEAYRERCQRRGAAPNLRGDALPTLEQVAGADHLIAVYYRMRREAGRSPGPGAFAPGQIRPP